MAQLPPNGDWLIQQISGEVILFHRHTEEEVVRFDPSNADECAKAQSKIHSDERLTDEAKCFAHFWSGYFYAHNVPGFFAEAPTPEKGFRGPAFDEPI
jgi:hypothetical protein